MDTMLFEKKYLLAVLLNNQCCGGTDELVNQAKNNPHDAVGCKVEHLPKWVQVFWGALSAILGTALLVLGMLYYNYCERQYGEGSRHEAMAFMLTMASLLIGVGGVVWATFIVEDRNRHAHLGQSEEILRRISDISRLVREYPDVVNEAIASIKARHDQLNLLSEHIDRILKEAKHRCPN